MIRVLWDTNAIIRAVISRPWKEEQRIMEHTLTNPDFTFILTQYVEMEVKEKLRIKFPSKMHLWEPLVRVWKETDRLRYYDAQFYADHIDQVNPPLIRNDPDDQVIIDFAWMIEPDVLLTDDKHFYQFGLAEKVKTEKGIDILRPEQFIQRYM